MAQGYKDFTAGAVLTAADLEDYNQNQSIMRFASAAARDSALTTVKVEGMMAYLIDVNTVTVYSGSAWSTVGPVHGGLTGFTPVVVQGVTPTLVVSYSSWSRVGRQVTGRAIVTITSTGTSGSVITVSLPVNANAAAVSDYLSIGRYVFADAAGGGSTSGDVCIAAAGTMKLASTLGVSPTFLGPNGPIGAFALANPDIISVTYSYEAAADA